MQFSLLDRHGNGYALRRAPWAFGTPVDYFIDHPTANGQPEKLERDDPRLKAASVLALAWVDRRYSRKQQKRIFAGEFNAEQPFDDDKARASEVLWLFREQEMSRQR